MCIFSDLPSFGRFGISRRKNSNPCPASVFLRGFFSLSLVLGLALISCSARITGEVKQGGAMELSVTTALEPRTVSLLLALRNFTEDTSVNTSAPLLDGPAVGRSIAAAPGVRAASLRNTSSSAVEGTISISNVQNFLAAGSSQARLVTYTEGQGAGNSSIIISLDRASAPEIIARLSLEVEEYLLALMAPAVIGESSTKQEYLQLITLVYGRGVAEEIAAARIKASIDFPRNISSIRGGTSSGRRAEFDISLLDVLVLEQPLRYEVRW